jgi:hypothetical protein
MIFLQVIIKYKEKMEEEDFKEQPMGLYAGPADATS